MRAHERKPLLAGDVEVLTPGLRAIIWYKLGKGALQIIACVAMSVALGIGHDGWLADLDHALRAHFTTGWSAQLAEWVARHLNTKVLTLGAVALGADAIVSLVEGWALHRRHWWGPWVVVIASGSLLPVEVYEIFRHPHAGRVLIFLLNLVIVIYLGRRALLEHRERKFHPA